MYQAALSIVNYVERPDFGTNRYIMDSTKILHTENEFKKSSGIEGRFVTPEGTINNINVLEG